MVILTLTLLLALLTKSLELQVPHAVLYFFNMRVSKAPSNIRVAEGLRTTF